MGLTLQYSKLFNKSNFPGGWCNPKMKHLFITGYQYRVVLLYGTVPGTRVPESGATVSIAVLSPVLYNCLYLIIYIFVCVLSRPLAPRMAAFTPASSSSPRRSSSFLDGGDGADGAASAEWAAMSSAARVRYNDGPPSALEAAALVALRAALGDLCGAAPLKDQPENVSEFKLLRFLRGYAGDVAAAEAAYREMAAFRAAHGLDALRERLVANGGSAPHLWDEYQPIVACVSRGVRHQYGVDAYGNVLTMTDIGALDLRAIVKGGLQDLYVQFCMVTEEHGNLTLHELSEQAGKLIARHDVINVVNFGFFQWNKACYDLLGPIFEAGKHYPESVRKITSCGNGSVAVAAWQVMKNFIPERTKKKPGA